MNEVREGHKAKLFVKIEDGSKQEIDCFVKEIHNDRLILSFSDEHLDISEYAEYLDEGNDLSVRIYTKSGIKAFESLVLDFSDETSLIIDYSEENTVNIQRRAHCRIKFDTKICIERQNKKNVIGRTIEVSGGSIMFYIDEKFFPSEPVEFSLYIPDSKAIKARGVILDVPHLSQNQYVVCFTQIGSKDRDILNQSVLLKQSLV